MARDDVAHIGVHAWIQKKYSRIKKKEEVEKHRVQTQNTDA